MSCDEMKILLSGLIDGELEDEQKKTIEDHIVSCDNCREEYSRLLKLKEVTNDMKHYDLPDRLMAGYWQGIYSRTERGFGWILLSIGAILLVTFAAWHLLNGFFLDPTVPVFLKAGLGLFLFGMIILLVSIIRERLFSKKHDRYDEVEL
ncbi:MAG: zf-HC2 domain-containing protein [candidate division Zixibacteria bacterium]